VDFVQANQSRSTKIVLRVLQGTVLDVVVDIRKSSPTFGQNGTLELSAENKRMLLIPEGFAHGLVVLTDTAEFCTRPPITGFLNMSGAYAGMIRRWR
jgi:dTDP-4-dehydrorhamnose 3,5-epimerase